jgi:hypothetical protein
VIVVPNGTDAAQDAPQLIAGGVLVTTPLPLPDFVTLTRTSGVTAATEIETVARFESMEPSHAANVNESLPEKP